MDMTIHDALDKAVKTNTAFRTFEELCQAGLKGYAPTLGLDMQGVGLAFEARMRFEGCKTRVLWADWRR